MEKKFNSLQVASMRRTAANVFQYTTKRDKLIEKLNKIQKEVDEINEMIRVADYPTVQITGGYTSEDLFVREKVEGSSVHKFVLKYPDTIIPVETEQTTEETPSLMETQSEETADVNYIGEETLNY